MDSQTMDAKLSKMGGRESGLEKGEDVRGTHSRGAKDVAALGHVIRWHEVVLRRKPEAAAVCRLDICGRGGLGDLAQIRGLLQFAPGLT